MNEVESRLSGFYAGTAGRIATDDGTKLFTELAARKTRAAGVVADICEKAACGENLLDKPTEEDLHFLSALTQSAFYRNVGNIEELFHPSLDTTHLVENALRLERDLMLFYMKFFHASCAAQRPVFSELLRQTQTDVSELNNLRARLKRGL
ncbi:hypothetical protein FJY71_10205 [candidate division WOR-3 bacterium]|nr:hypothetical protein [candidate division WOR-3 bacterium]